jgi:hypothetical protein
MADSNTTKELDIKTEVLDTFLTGKIDASSEKIILSKNKTYGTTLPTSGEEG